MSFYEKSEHYTRYSTAHQLGISRQNAKVHIYIKYTKHAILLPMLNLPLLFTIHQIYKHL